MESNFLETTTVSRRPHFVEGEGLAPLADMEAGFSGKTNFFSTSSRHGYRTFPRSLSSSPRSGSFGCEENHHFLDSCFLCKKPIGGNRDIFMYRGNTPFCSEECRQEQIDMDEAKEKNWGMSMKVGSRKEQQKSSKNKNQDFHVRAGTVVAG